MKKKLLIFLSIIVLGLLVLFAEVGYKIKTFMPLSSSNPDVLLVLGCGMEGTKPNPFLKARLDKAIQIYKQGGVNLMIVSGGQGWNEQIPESEAMRAYLIENSIPQDKIMVENQSKNTIQNIQNSQAILATFSYKNLLIISNDYHLRRIDILARKNNLAANYNGVSVPNYRLQENLFFYREIVASIYHGLL